LQITVKRRANGYRVYDSEDINKLKIIRSLRCANYSLSSILRLMNAFFRDKSTDVEQALNTPDENEDIVSVYDRLIISLKRARENAEQIIAMLTEMKSKY
jgi:DNA-binding transcriptional MerR regulator